MLSKESQFLFLLMFGFASLLFYAGASLTNASPAPASTPFALLADGQFVNGPNVGAFSVGEYLSRIASPLTPQAGQIEQWCAYASVNPRVVLAILESQGRLGIPAAESFESEIENLVVQLSTQFYKHLYTHGSRSRQKGAADTSIWLTLGDGTSVALPSRINSATYAILSALAPSLDHAGWERYLSTSDVNGFLQSYRRLFPESDSLDNRNVIDPASLPPGDLLQLPYPVGASWWFNGPHSWRGGGYEPPYSSIDFGTTGTCAAPPNNDWTVAAAAGISERTSTCLLRVKHDGGWITSYYHLRQTRGSGVIGRNEHVGLIGCETCIGGFATVPHVHFSLLYNGAFVDLEGVQLSGWTIHVGDGGYYTGYLERDGLQARPYERILNDGIRDLTDSRPPAASWVNPTNGQRIITSTLSLQVAASDSDSGVNRVRFSAAWAGGWRTLAIVSTPPYSYTWNVCDAGVPDGDIELGLEAWDNAGYHYVYSADAPNIRVTKQYSCAAGWHVEYYTDKTMTTRCAELWENGAYVFKDWGLGAPAAGCPADGFAARFTKSVEFQGGQYAFYAQHDGGIRLFLDDSPLWIAWQDGERSGAQSRNVLPGRHEMKIEYYDDSGPARLEAWWAGPGALPDIPADPCQWRAEYWANRSLWGKPVLSLNEGNGFLSHAWEVGGPGYGLPDNQFSARFQRQTWFDCGRYQFRVVRDDGVRFWIDDQLKLDAWADGVIIDDFVADLPAGFHNLRLEYYENAGAAALQFMGIQQSACIPPTTTPISTSAPSPTPSPTTTSIPSTPTPTPTVTPTSIPSPTLTPTIGPSVMPTTPTPTPTETPASAPVPPILLHPADGAWFKVGQSITLIWSATGNEYYGEIYGGAAGVSAFGWQNENQHYIGTLPAGFACIWRVKARRGGLESEWSLPAAFSVRPATISLPFILKVYDEL